MELGVPITQWAELQVAARYEDFEELGEDTIDPKVSVLIRPTDSLSLRFSAGSSFRVPSLQQSFGSLTTVGNERDLVGGTTFKPAITTGNPNLAPESADNVNIGVSWVPQDGVLEGLSIDVDWYDYEYTDIITRESTSTLISEDNALLQAWTLANVPGATCVAGNCPEAFQAVNAGVGNRSQVIRNAQGVLLRTLPMFANANGADIRGMDLSASYRFDNDWGNWRVGVQAAWIETYNVQVKNSAGGITEIDGVGNYNQSNPVARPLPEWKVNGTLSWSKDNHRLFAMVKWVDELESDIPAGTRGFFAAVARMAGNDAVAGDLGDAIIEDFTTVDLQYNYNFGEQVFMSDTNLTLGIQNLFDEEPPHIAVVTAYDGRLHDGRGRMFFLRVSGSM
jgi:iron complex outermembrane receptor protein